MQSRDAFTKHKKLIYVAFRRLCFVLDFDLEKVFAATKSFSVIKYEGVLLIYQPQGQNYAIFVGQNYNTVSGVGQFDRFSEKMWDSHLSSLQDGTITQIEIFGRLPSHTRISLSM